MNCFKPDEPDVIKKVDPQVEEILHAIVECGGGYPDIIQFLQQATAQRKIKSRLAFDAIPTEFDGRLSVPREVVNRNQDVKEEDDQSEGDLVVETLVAALAKDDGGITAQMLGKSFLSSGNDIRPDLDLPEGMSLNSEEANTFIEEKAMQEIEKVMLVSARVKNVEYVPTKFNQLSGFDDIRVPILNDETGDVVFLDMGNIDFKPQVLPANFNEDQPQLLPRIPEQLFLKGGDENVFIDFDEGQFVETVFDPEIEILDQKYQAAINAGATQDEIEEIFIEMDEVMQKADESMVTINMESMENEIMPAGLNMDFLTAEEFVKEQDSFLFSTDVYTESWEQAEEGKVAIFKIDGSVDYVDQEDANTAWEAADEAYEQEFADCLLYTSDAADE